MCEKINRRQCVPLTEGDPMRYSLLMVFLFCAAGCQNVIGPFEPRAPMRVDDPRYSIGEQESRGRDRYAIPDSSPLVAPPAGGVFAPGR